MPSSNVQYPTSSRLTKEIVACFLSKKQKVKPNYNHHKVRMAAESMENQKVKPFDLIKHPL